MLVTEVETFRRFWYPVAFAEDLDTGPIARTVLGTELVVWSDGRGGASAAVDRCPHRSAKLSLGTTADGCLVCPFHRWRYGSEGRAVHVPGLGADEAIPAGAELDLVSCVVRHRVIWVSLDEPVGGIPDLDDLDELDGYRWIRQFDEVWAAAAPRLVDNSFDPAHIAFVHRGTFGTPANARIDTPAIEPTADGLVMRTHVTVENHLDIAKRSNRIGDERTVRTTVSRFIAPFLRVMSTTYPNGLHHVLVTGICPVDDAHLRLVQWAMRNDDESDIPAADVIAFDRAVTLEDQALLERTDPDYALGITDNVHIKVDRGTIAVRSIYRDLVAGTWAGLTGVAAE